MALVFNHFGQFYEAGEMLTQS